MFRKNFYNFINEFRIEAAKEILQDPSSKGKNILQIAYEVGFNSKSAFNTYFKRLTGKTPSAYRKEAAE